MHGVTPPAGAGTGVRNIANLHSYGMTLKEGVRESGEVTIAIVIPGLQST